VFTFKLRRGTASHWLAVNPILLEGEPGVEIDTGKMKLGNGFDTWSELKYLLNEDAKQEIIDQINAEGIPGADGDSAYEVAVANGFVGTEAAWLLSLKGEQGIQGPAGAQGPPGEAGANGAQGIQGPPGVDGSDGAQGIQGIQGPPGEPGADGADGVDYTGPTITVSSSAPSSPQLGDIWIDTSE
jgi:hypothetical protein